MKKIKKRIKKAVNKKKLKLKKWFLRKVECLKNWIISLIQKIWESFNKFIARQTWIITVFALIGGGYVLYLSGNVFVPCVKQMLDEKFVKVIVIENTIPEKEAKEDGIEVETEVEDVTEEIKPQNFVEEEIVKMFPEEPKKALAIFKAESRLNLQAKGWNCFYHDSEGERYSAACKKEDRSKAWSVDCGVAQINTLGKVCSQDLFDLGNNLKIAREKYEKRGWQPWVAHENDSYKKYL